MEKASSSLHRQALKKWTDRQIDLFGKKGLTLQQLRIKNPGQARVARFGGFLSKVHSQLYKKKLSPLAQMMVERTYLAYDK